MSDIRGNIEVRFHSNVDTSLDEVVVKHPDKSQADRGRVLLHLEQMDVNSFWMRITGSAGEDLVVWFTALEDGTLSVSQEWDEGSKD